MKPPPAPINVPNAPTTNPTTTRVATSRPLIAIVDLGRPPRAELRVGQPRALEGVPAKPAAERLESQNLLGRDVAQVDVWTEPLDEVPLLGSKRRLPEDAARIAHAPEEGLDLPLLRQARRVVNPDTLAG